MDIYGRFVHRAGTQTLRLTYGMGLYGSILHNIHGFCILLYSPPTPPSLLEEALAVAALFPFSPPAQHRQRAEAFVRLQPPF